METLSKFSLPGIVLLLTLASGFWLGSSGKPLNTALFNLHKLIALAAVILTAVQLNGALKSTDIQALLVTLAVVAGVCVLALFTTGALMSLGKLSYDTLQITHTIAAILVVVAMAGTIFLLAMRQS